MAVKTFKISQLADLRIGGIDINASYSINLLIKDENTETGKIVCISAAGKSNAAKAAGSGNLLFWCKVKNLANNKVYIIENKKSEHFAVGIDDILIGSVIIGIAKDPYKSPKIEVEGGYLYDAGSAGTIPPFPCSTKKIISLTPF